jgi:hypothetical protein
MRLAAAFPLLVLVHFACASAPREAEVRTAAKSAVRAKGGAGTPLAADESLEAMLVADEAVGPMLDQAEALRLQVLVGIPEERDGRPVLERKGYRVDAEYFYPASAIKPFIAAMALEKLVDLRRENPRAVLDTTTPLRVYDPLTKRGEERDLSDNKRFKISLGQEIRKALIVSDNFASSRLYDFVGYDELNERLTQRGFRSLRVRHRLITTTADPRDTPRIELLPATGGSVDIPARHGTRELSVPEIPGLSVGEARLDELGRRVAEPMSFADRNRASLADLQELMVRIMRPELGSGEPLRVSAQDRDVLIDALVTLPSESKNPVVERTRTFDEFQKPLLAAMTAALPGHRVRIYGKAGRAFGFMVENAYIVDETSHRSVFFTATAFGNSDQTMNDDKYDYERVSGPLLANVARLVAKQWLEQPR